MRWLLSQEMFMRSVIRRYWGLGQAIYHGRAWTQKPQVLYEKKRHQKLLRCGAGEMAQSGKHLLCKHEDLSSILSTFKSWAWQPYLISELLTQMRDLLASFWGTHRRLTAGLHLHMCTWTRIYAHIYTLEKGLRCIKTMWHVYLC